MRAVGDQHKPPPSGVQDNLAWKDHMSKRERTENGEQHPEQLHRHFHAQHPRKV